MKDFKLSVGSIHQPQYLPWFFYFQKILESDFFVFLDNAQFQKNGIQNRNKIKNKDGELWLTVPVKRSLDTKINEVEIENTKNWKKKHLKTIEESYSKSKFYNYYKKEFEEIYGSNFSRLSSFNIELIKFFLKKMNINTKIILGSEMSVTGNKSQLLLQICQRLQSKTYLSGYGGKDYLDENLFQDKKIKIKYIQYKEIIDYEQPYQKLGHIKNLSILDFLFNVGDNWKDYLR